MLQKKHLLLIVDKLEPNGIVENLTHEFTLTICNPFNLEQQLKRQKLPDLYLFLNKKLRTVQSTLKRYPHYFANPLYLLWWPQENQPLPSEDIKNCLEQGICYIIPFHSCIDLVLAKINGRIKANHISKNIYQREVYIGDSSHHYHKDSETLDKVVNYLNEKNLDHDFSIEKMGKDIGMSRTNFFSKIKSLTGLSPSRMVMNYRLRKAAFLITESDKNICDIAFEVGFSSTTYFTRCFKEKFGKSPSKYGKSKGSIIEINDFSNLDFEDSPA
jgi:AraC-like DNA-binding protein